MKIIHCYPKNTFHLRFHLSSEDKAETRVGVGWTRPATEEQRRGAFPRWHGLPNRPAGPTSDNRLGPDPHLIKSAL